MCFTVYKIEIIRNNAHDLPILLTSDEPILDTLISSECRHFS